MKRVFIAASTSMLLGGCAVFGPILGFDQSSGTLFNYNQEIEKCGNIEPAPIIYTKEGFPIIDDQAPILLPCSEVLGVTVSSSSGEPNVEPSVQETTEPDPTPTSEPTPDPTPTSEPAPDPAPTSEPTPDPAPTSEPTPDPTPDKVKGNNGYGNGDQDAPGGSCANNSAENADCGD